MLSPEVNREYCKVNFYIPVMTAANDDPYFKEGAMSGFVRGMNDPNFVREPYYGYFPELGEFMETIYDAEIQSYLLGQQSLDALCDNISKFLTEKQQAYMKENPNTPIPVPITIR
jgi:multiple sugar transport system substrate-binding protein